MKTDHPHRPIAVTGLGLLATVCIVVLGPIPRLTCALAASKKPPVFSDVPGLTTNPPPAGTFSPLPAVTPSSPAAKPVPVTPPVAVPTVPPPAVVVPPPAAPPSTAVSPVPVDDQGAGKTLYSFQAADLDLKIALTTFARANNLNIVPDHDITGTVTLDIRDLPLNQMMRALLEANDCTWQEENGLIRVRSVETRTFNVDYLRLSRKGIGYTSVTLGSGSGTGGMGAGMMGGGGGGAPGGVGGAGGGINSGSSSVNLTADNVVDFWKELRTELDFLLTDAGKKSLAVNMTAGILQITDRPSALKRVEDYLSGVDRSIHRQVEIEAKIYNVTLNDQFQFGIDWVHLAEAYGGTLGFGGATLPVANGGAQLADSALGGINRVPIIGSTASTVPLGNLSTLVFTNFNTAAAVNAMAQQGNVEVVSKPRIRTMNNQTAIIKVGEEVPFFASSSTLVPGTVSGTSTALGSVTVNSVTVGTILSLTPQISDNNWISLEVSPVLTALNGPPVQFNSGVASASASATAPDLITKQASTLVRVSDGTTVVLGGLIQTQQARNDTKIPLLGDIPLLGRLFRGTFRFKQRQELVIFVTPHIVRDGMERPIPVVPDVLEMEHKP